MQIVVQRFNILGLNTHLIGIFDAQHEITPSVTRKQRAKQRDTGVTQVQVACWTGRETCSDGRICHESCMITQIDEDRLKPSCYVPKTVYYGNSAE